MSMSITPASQPEISFCSLSLNATPMIMLVTLFFERPPRSLPALDDARRKGARVIAWLSALPVEEFPKLRRRDYGRLKDRAW
jgi:hypothetical protein